MGALKPAHGGVLVNGYADPDEIAAIKADLSGSMGIRLTPRQLCDLELLLNGAYSPLTGFMDQASYASVRDRMRLPDETLWPLPVILAINTELASKIAVNDRVQLLNEENVTVALLVVTELWGVAYTDDCEAFFGSTDRRHIGVQVFVDQQDAVCLAGRVTGLVELRHHDFNALRQSPRELRARFARHDWRRVIAFHTRDPIHRAEFQLTLDAAHTAEANLLLHPAIGPTIPNDDHHYMRVHCYEKVLAHYTEQTTALSVIELPAFYAGPREALLHGIVRKNHGCTHIIVTLDHASPVPTTPSLTFYAAAQAQALFSAHQAELDIMMIATTRYCYTPQQGRWLALPLTAAGTEDALDNQPAEPIIDHAEGCWRLERGIDLPPWFSFDNVLQHMRKVIKVRHQQGFTVFFTGISGAGKSTIAHALLVKLHEAMTRSITLLDGDIVRRFLSSDLGFSKRDRDQNILRIGFVATEITRSGGVAICAAIAPYAETRQRVRDKVSNVGGFIEVYVNTPLAVCEQRDRKGIYAAARAGRVKNLTGVNDPYEVPENPEVRIDTERLTPALAAHRILLKLQNLDYIR